MSLGSAQFDHERLDVYRTAIDFVAWCGELLDGPLSKSGLSALRQLDRAATSIPLNIAEGNGKRSRVDRCRFLDIARGSALESAACLDVIVARKRTTPEAIVDGKQLLLRVVDMLSRLIARLSDSAGEVLRDGADQALYDSHSGGSAGGSADGTPGGTPGGSAGGSADGSAGPEATSD